MSLGVLELDGFRDYNEEVGYDVGNLVLVELARHVLDGVRSVDIVGRCRGDQYMVLMDGIGSVKARDILLGIRDRWGVRHGISFRIGVVEYSMGMTALDFLNEARSRLC